MHRSHTCGELRKDHTGQSVTLAGWVDDIRDMGGLYFLTLRDRYGITQVTTNDLNGSDVLEQLKSERCIKVTGTVAARPAGQENNDMLTGDIELQATEITVLNKCKELPFPIRDDANTSEENRFKNRFLDLRRNPVMKNIEFRARMNHFTRNWFTNTGFLEVQTPLFTVSSPEGARDYLIPSRVNPGKFYALPQAPQQYKQLLMVGGVDKYFQIAPCFRDEDPRADRHSCEFYQVDAEMSFVERDDVFAVAEGYMKDMVAELVPHKKIITNFVHIPFHEAQERFGSDKPDLRFGMEFVDVSDIVAGSEFGVFANTVKDGGIVKAIKLEGEKMSRKEIDAITDVAKQAGAGGLAYFIYDSSDKEIAPYGVRSPIVKFFKPEELEALATATGAQEGDMVFFGAGTKSLVHKVLNKVRLYCRDTYNLANDKEMAFVWITDFPFYEYDEGRGEWDWGHNPFSHVVGGIESIKNNDFADIQTTQYDLVMNGFEILSGSIRNHDPEVMVAAFEKLGLSEKDVKERFGAMYEAFQYGAPPHGGFAFGFDRIMMILLDEPSIRECYAFPKSGRAEDVMMGAPAMVDDVTLDELHVRSVEGDDVSAVGNEEIYNAICGMLSTKNIAYKTLIHKPTFTSEESAQARGESLEIGGKALVVKVGKEFNVFILSASKKLSKEKMKSLFGKKTRFATKEELLEQTGLVPGSVPPFGDPILPYKLYIDESITKNEKIAFNAGLLTHSVIFSTKEYLEVANGDIIDIAE